MIVSAAHQVMSALRRHSYLWLAGVSFGLVCAPLSAKEPVKRHVREHVHARADSRLPAALFYSYPPVPSTAYAPRHHVRPYALNMPLRIDQPGYGRRERYGATPDYGRFPYGQVTGGAQLSGPGGTQGDQGLPAYPLSADPAAGASSVTSDDWSFSASPVINLNHSHERGATFSIRHDF
ncbi:conserved hypothetical protein [Paraburkholderia sabiae]|uniref:hypothetical protein n=1 Tax=Paraburkholderia sabiae TaxID=273251 RepID=UPI001CB476B8|nr:hypothetical protein [Paraburkholderia sabiae]CAG9220181.1 conserved hypothetical protein [Paraburkholderia sabiae]